MIPSRQKHLESQQNNIRRCSNVILLTFNGILPAGVFFFGSDFIRLNFAFSHADLSVKIVDGVIPIASLSNEQHKKLEDVFASKLTNITEVRWPHQNLDGKETGRPFCVETIIFSNISI